jgi:hypothetical protein
MSATSTIASPMPADRTREKKRRLRSVGGTHLGRDASREAKRLAAAILEVLAGLRTPADAARALEVSLPRYYQVESRALGGLLRACEPRGKGRQKSVEQEVTVLRRDQERLRHQLARQQALLRLAQRSVGLAPPAPLVSAKGSGKKTRRPVARALQVAVRLRPQAVPVPEPEVSVQQEARS